MILKSISGHFALSISDIQVMKAVVCSPGFPNVCTGPWQLSLGFDKVRKIRSIHADMSMVGVRLPTVLSQQELL